MRVLHWTLAAGVAAAWLTHEGPGWAHDGLGYVALGAVAVRLAWGFVAPRHARFDDFVRSPAAIPRYARLVARGREPRYLGHNPLGGWMIVALLATVAGTGLSGWLYTTDAFWGVAWVETAHSSLADLTVALVGLHMGGVLFTSIRERENLMAAMIHGRKRAPSGRDVA